MTEISGLLSLQLNLVKNTALMANVSNVENAVCIHYGTQVIMMKMVFGYHGDAEWGPTAITGFWNGIDPPTGGYTIYYMTELKQEPSIIIAHNDNECILLARQFGGSNINTISDATNYFSSLNPDTNIFSDSGLILPIS